MRAFYLAIVIVAAVLIAADNKKGPAEVSARDIGGTLVIVGDLGQPLGETVTIHGKKVWAPKGEQVDFLVDSVNGRKLKTGRRVRIDGIVDWPLGSEAEIRGQEEGTVTFTDINHGGHSSRDPRFVLRQTVYLSFDAAQVVSPKGLSLRP